MWDVTINCLSTLIAQKQARRAADRWEVAHSDFLTPPVLGDSLAAIRKLSDVGALVSGGYGQVLSLSLFYIHHLCKRCSNPHIDGSRTLH